MRFRSPMARLGSGACSSVVELLVCGARFLAPCSFRNGQCRLRRGGAVGVAVVVVSVSAGSEPSGYQWHFREAPPNYIHGPAFWVEGDRAAMHVYCFRRPGDIQPNLEPGSHPFDVVVAPRRLMVRVTWFGRLDSPPHGTVVGGTRDLLDTQWTAISIQFDGGVEETQDWSTRWGYKQYLEGNAARGFLQRLVGSRRVTFRTDLVETGRRSEAFDVTKIRELLVGMAADCQAVRPLLERNAISERGQG